MPRNQILVRTTYLEISADNLLRNPDRKRPNFELNKAIMPSPELARFLYCSVGYAWNWTSRLNWTYSEWESYVTDQRIETWVAYVTGSIAGYFELAIANDGVEIRAFGILQRFTGCGIGGFMLCDATERGRSIGPGRVWLHTCTEDHPHAIPNYQSRGFRIYKEENKCAESTSEFEPWPGAFRNI